MAMTTVIPATNVIADDKETSIKIITSKREQELTKTPIKVIPGSKKEATKTPTIVIPGGKKEETTKEPEVTKKPSTGVTNEKKEETVKQQEVLKEGQDSQFKYSLLEDGSGYCITEYFGDDSEVVIPEKFNGLQVKSIGEDAFYWCSNLVSINIPSSVTSIGDYAFPEGCKVIRVDK